MFNRIVNKIKKINLRRWLNLNFFLKITSGITLILVGKIAIALVLAIALSLLFSFSDVGFAFIFYLIIYLFFPLHYLWSRGIVVLLVGLSFVFHLINATEVEHLIGEGITYLSIIILTKSFFTLWC